MKKRIIFATGNEGKMREVRMILADLDYEIVSMKGSWKLMLKLWKMAKHLRKMH